VNLINKSLLERLKRKSRGNTNLEKSIDKLILDIEQNEWSSQFELKQTRPDADSVHSKGFYFFNINVHRTMILIEFDENKQARIIWTGSHQEYEITFKNNRNTIKKWLRDNEWIK
jgi:mRNA interferase HigB